MGVGVLDAAAHQGGIVGTRVASIGAAAGGSSVPLRRKWSRMSSAAVRMAKRILPPTTRARVAHMLQEGMGPAGCPGASDAVTCVAGKAKVAPPSVEYVA